MNGLRSWEKFSNFIPLCEYKVSFGCSYQNMYKGERLLFHLTN